MAAVRRWYVLLVCVISLQSVTWAAIELWRSLLHRGASVSVIAFQIAVVVIGLPIFLVHWLWAQRLARREAGERQDVLRRVYLYGTLAAFLAPFAVITFDLIVTLLTLALSGRRLPAGYTPVETILRPLVAMIVLGLLWFYHRWIVAEDARVIPETGSNAAVRRWYILGFSAAGVTVTTWGVIGLLHWIMFQFGSRLVTTGDAGIEGLIAEVARLCVGVPLWLLFWRWAQRLFVGPSEQERGSELRKLYLYLAVFIAALSAVTSAAIVLSYFFRRLLGLVPTDDLRWSFSIGIGTALLWAFHAVVLRGDAALAEQAPRQAGIRRLYLYLVAAVGLAAFLVGLSGDVSVLIRSLTERSFGDSLREQLAWFTAALFAGLPVWLLPWRRVQSEAVAAGPGGAHERRSVVRKIYLYFYLFVATMTALSSMVYIVYRVLSQALGQKTTGSLLADLAQAIAFTLIAVGVWLYHGSSVRGDGRLNQREQMQRLADLRVAVLDAGDGQLGRAVLEGLRRELPGLTLAPIGLTPLAVETLGAGQGTVADQLAGAGLIVGPWTMVMAGSPVASAIAASPARKILVPAPAPGYEWAGQDQWNTESLVRQTVHAVKQIVGGEQVKTERPMSAGAIALIVVGVFVSLACLASALMPLISNLR
jgi:hypothetical protein